MSFVAVAVGTGVAGIGGALISSSAANSAAEKQAAASDRSSQLQYDMYQQQRDDTAKQLAQQRTDYAPWLQAGGGALSALTNGQFNQTFNPADVTSDPGYAFRMQEGQKALERSAAARGGLQSGGTLKAISRYGQDYASNEYNNAYNRFSNDQTRRFNQLSSIAGLGQNANSQLASSGMNGLNSMNSAGQNYANNVGQNMIGTANAQGAAGIAGANAWSGALSNVGRLGTDYAAMQNQNTWMDRLLKARGQ